MTTIIQKSDIESLLQNIDAVANMETAFKEYSRGNAVVPPVGELLFDKPKGEAHIKYGYIKNQNYYVIKIASGFYNNPSLGISSSQGMMLLFNQNTGQPAAVLLDDGLLTDIRTAAAGAVVAKYFSPKKIKAIGIIGTGIQARLQLQYLQKHTPAETVWIWGRSQDNINKMATEFQSQFDVKIASSTTELASHANVIVTTTPSEKPLLHLEDILPGTHITAMGSDTSFKQELGSQILAKADIVISDSIPQSMSRGEVFRARKSGLIADDKIVELGAALENKSLQRISDEQITIADLTGVAVQDIMIATAVFEAYNNHIQ